MKWLVAWLNSTLAAARLELLSVQLTRIMELLGFMTGES